MALPTPDNLKTMDYAFQGQPFVDVPAKDAVDIETMDYAFQGQPFVRNYAAGVTMAGYYYYKHLMGNAA